MTQRSTLTILAGLAAAAGLALLPLLATAQGSYYFWWQVVDQRGVPIAGVALTRCSVYDVSASHAAATGAAKVLHIDAQLSSGTTQPLTSDAAGKFHFWSSTSSDVYVVCYYARGGAATDVRLSRFDHTVMIDREGRKVVRFNYVNSTSVTNTGVWLPAGAVIRDVIIQNVSGPANTHINVGWRDSHTTAFGHTWSALVHVQGLGTGTTWIRPHAVVSFSGATGVSPQIVEVHRGMALAIWHTVGIGTAAQRTGKGEYGAEGFYLERSFPLDLPIELTYQTGGAGSISGHVYIFFDQLHTGLIPAGTRGF